MPDISPPPFTFPTRQALELQLALCGSDKLQGVEVLTPPPAPKGRYVLAKATDAVLSVLRTYEKARGQVVNEHTEKDEKGNAISPAPGQVKIRDVAAFNAVIEPMLDEPVTLPGLRQITRAELGDCPITAFQERVLIKCGLLKDEEPS
jgi:hypothetical protein